MRWFDRRSAACVALLCVLVMAGCGGSTATSNGTATPSFSPGGGSYNTTQSVTIADTTPGAVLYCTTDGTQPTTSSAKCSQPTVISKSMYLQAIAVAPGKSASAVASAGFTIDLNAAATPTFSPVGGTYTAAQAVTVTSATSGALIYYTLDGTTPTTSSTLYTGPITVSSSQTLNAIAVATGYNDSGVASSSYVISYPAATPVISLASGTYTSTQSVTITDATSGATIYYTTDTSIPSATNGKVYSTPIGVSSSQTVAAVAVASGYSSSAVASATYTINLDAATPTFAINGVTLGASATVNASTTLTFNDTPANATIYYTLDGKTPSASYNSGSITPGNSITVNPPTDGTTSVTVNADAVSASGKLSSMASVTLNFQAVAPTFTANGATTTGGQYTLPLTVGIADTLSGATTYYYIGTSAPSTSDLASWTQGTSVTISTPGTLWATAVASGYAPSTPVSATFYAQPTVMGTVESGTTEIYDAQVYLYHAGGNASTSAASAYGTNAELVTTTPAGGAGTDSNGKFTLTYDKTECSSSPDDQWFLVATGGTVGGSASNSNPNTSIALMTALGTCSDLGNTKTVVINEATTVASVWALQQFMLADSSIEGGLNIGTSSGNYQGLVNAFNTVGNLVDVTTGYVWGQAVSGSSIPYGLPSDGSVTWHTTGSVGMTPAYAKGITPTRGTDGTLCSTTTSTTNGCNTTYQPTQYLNDSTVPTSRIDTLANVLASCVQMASNCSTLFTDATPPSTASHNASVAPTTLLQTALAMAQNPGNNVTTLYQMQGVNSAPTPYSPMLTVSSTTPVDMTLALTFTGGGFGGLPADYSSKVVIANGMDIDAAGSIYVVGVANDALDYAPTSSMIAKFSNLGIPVSAPTTYSSSTSTYTYGGVTTISPDDANYHGQSPSSVAIDLNGIAWIGNFQGIKKFDSSLDNLTDITSGGATSGGGAAAYKYRSMAFDAYNTLWSDYAASSSPVLYQLTSGSTTAVSYNPEGTTLSSSIFGGLTIDAKGYLWAIDSSNSSLMQLTSGAIVNSTFPTYTTASGIRSRTILGADATGDIYFCNGGTNISVSKAVDTSVTTTLPTLATYTGSASQPCGNALLVDGDGYLWSIYAGYKSGQGSIAKLKYGDTNLTVVSTAPYSGISSAEGNLLFSAGLNSSYAGIAGAQIDASGNIWSTNNSTGASATTNLHGNMLVEFVGLAAPVNTPVSKAVQLSTTAGGTATPGGLGQRP